MAQVANERMPSASDERPARIMTVPDRFLSKFWAILTSLLFHPFSYTVIRVIRPDDGSD
jgi:hypothetical protein